MNEKAPWAAQPAAGGAGAARASPQVAQPFPARPCSAFSSPSAQAGENREATFSKEMVLKLRSNCSPLLLEEQPPPWEAALSPHDRFSQVKKLINFEACKWMGWRELLLTFPLRHRFFQPKQVPSHPILNVDFHLQ